MSETEQYVGLTINDEQKEHLFKLLNRDPRHLVSPGPCPVVLDKGITYEWFPENPLTYRNEYPTEPGWYWVWDGEPESTMIMKITQDKIDRVKELEAKSPRRHYWYAGPITPPERPK